MLWSLALAAAAGVLAVLYDTGSVVWQVVGTGIATAATCVLLIPTSALIDRRPWRTVGMIAMAVVILEFMGASILIWEIPNSFALSRPFNDDVELKIAFTMVFTGMGLGAFLCANGLFISRRNSLAGRTAFFLSTIVCLLYYAATWLWNIRGERDAWWETAGAALALSTILCLSLLHLDEESRRHWRWVGIAACVAAGYLWNVNIWRPTNDPIGFVIFTVLLSVGVVIAHANLCLEPRLIGQQRWVRAGTISCAAATGLLIVLSIANERLPGYLDFVYPQFARAAAAFGILAGSGTLALFVLGRMNQRVFADADSPTDWNRIEAVCPRCRKKLSLPPGDSTCAACGLRIFIRIEEPRCANCGYLLYAAVSDRCPECGLAIMGS